MPPRKKTAITFANVQSTFFFGLLFLLGLASVYLVLPYIYPIFWAGIIAVMFRPMYRRLEKHLKMPAISSVLSVILVIVTLLLPLTVVSLLVLQETAKVYQTFEGTSISQVIDAASVYLGNTSLAPYLDPIKDKSVEWASSAAQSVGQWVFNSVAAITQNSISFVFMLFIMLYTLFYFFKDGKRILQRIMYLSPLGDKYETMLFEKFTSTARATLKSTLIIGTIQGAIGAVAFWIAGVQGVFIWGVLMVVLSMIPAVGAFIVWVPVAIYLLATGQMWQGLFVTFVGAVIIGMIDNILRPPLIGKDTQMHPILVLFSTLGGLSLFGVSGFVIGPVLMSLFLAVVSIYTHYYQTELKKN